MTPEEILEAIGFKGEPSQEAIVKHINENYIPKSKAQNDPDLDKHYSGRVFGLQNQLLAKLSGGKFTREQLQEMGYEKAFEAVISAKDEEIKLVKEKSKEGEAKQLTELKAKLEDYEKSIQDYERDKSTLVQKLQEVEGGAQEQIKSFKLNAKKKDVFSGLNWKDGISEVERVGFDAYIASNYREDLDDKEELVIKDKDGHTIQNPKKAGEVLSYAEVVRELAEKNKLLKANDAKPGQTAPPRKIETTEPTGALRKPLQALG